jgi:hypothetical protein
LRIDRPDFRNQIREIIHPDLSNCNQVIRACLDCINQIKSYDWLSEKDKAAAIEGYQNSIQWIEDTQKESLK